MDRQKEEKRHLVTHTHSDYLVDFTRLLVLPLLYCDSFHRAVICSLNLQCFHSSTESSPTRFLKTFTDLPKVSSRKLECVRVMIL